MNNNPRRAVFFISDGTGITTETLGHSFLARFPDFSFRQIRHPFIDSLEKATQCAEEIRQEAKLSGVRPIIFSTLVDKKISATIRVPEALCIDLFEAFLGLLETELGTQSSGIIGRFHGKADSQAYMERIEAINYSLAHDDGQTDAKLAEAEVILVGVSRSGKTPTSLYLAMQFGVKAANYPLIPEDFERDCLPSRLMPYRKKLYGLTIAPQRLAEIRQERRPNSRYAALDNCAYEIEAASRLMRRESIPFVESTSLSIEEISARILDDIRTEQRHSHL